MRTDKGSLVRLMRVFLKLRVPGLLAVLETMVDLSHAQCGTTGALSCDWEAVEVRGFRNWAGVAVPATDSGSWRLVASDSLACLAHSKDLLALEIRFFQAYCPGRRTQRAEQF